MNKDFKTLLLRMAFGIPAVIAGVVFRPFWQSDWGIPTFIFLVWVVISIAAGWGGKGKPYSLLFGLIVGSGFASVLVVTVLAESVYVGIGLLIALAYIGIKTKFFARRGAELDSLPKQ
ncbi:hypothetical protein [Mesorhizobium sp. LjRoot246]|uniref:hypothetical protein n=1 Tax=Mesorhizobium sp. LjRoot246 TaxID=3342294 RepID=UPI003ECE9331